MLAPRLATGDVAPDRGEGQFGTARVPLHHAAESGAAVQPVGYADQWRRNFEEGRECARCEH